MKKILSVLLAGMMLCGTLAIGASALEITNSVKFTTDYRDGSEPRISQVERGSVIDVIVDMPAREGYVFLGWYNNRTCVPYEFGAPINSDTIVYARWVREGIKPLMPQFDLLNIFCAIQQQWLAFIDTIYIYPGRHPAYN